MDTPRLESPRRERSESLSPPSALSSPPRPSSSSFSAMSSVPPRQNAPLSPMPHASSPASAQDPSQPLLPHVPAAPAADRSLSAMARSGGKKVAAVTASLTDMTAAGLSISDVTNTTTQHPYTRSMFTGGLWAASGAASLLSNLGESTPRQVVTDLANVGAGVASMAATVAEGQGSHGWTSGFSYVSNAAWAFAGGGAVYQGYKTLRDAKSSGWKKISGGLQVVSGLLNAGAGLAGAASTYYAEQDENDPRAHTAGLVSGGLWAAASVFGAASAWAGSGSAARPVVDANASIQDAV